MSAPLGDQFKHSMLMLHLGCSSVGDLLVFRLIHLTPAVVYNRARRAARRSRSSAFAISQKCFLEPVRNFLESPESVVILSLCARDSRWGGHVDGREPGGLRAQERALSERLERRVMDARGAASAAAAQAAREEGPATATADRSARGLERRALRADDRLPVAAAAEGLSAEKHRARLFHGLAQHRRARQPSSRALYAGQGACRSQPDA